MYVHGTGVHKEIECGREWKRILQGKFYGGVRGPMSVANISQLHQNVPIAGDAAFTMFDVLEYAKQDRNKKKILINFGHAFRLQRKNECQGHAKLVYRVCFRSRI